MTTALTLSLDAALRARLEAAAAERETTPEAIIETALADFLDESIDRLPLQDWQIEMIEEGLAAADNGEFASEEEVERVFAKYRS